MSSLLFRMEPGAAGEIQDGAFPSNHMTDHLSVRGLSVTLSGASILRDVSFDVARGEMVGLVGPNGSGKSTLLRCISGAQDYDGEALIDGRNVRDWPSRPLARALAFLRQSTTIEFDFTVEQLVLLGRAPHLGWLQAYGSADRALVGEALRRVELEPMRERTAPTLSGGELQRALLAQALVQEASLLLLDEPTAHLDVHHRFEFMEIVDELSRDGRTIITVFHDLDLAARFANRLLVLDRGRLVADGTPADVLTEQLLSDVFRMEAEVDVAPDGDLSIRFRGLARPASTRPSTIDEDLHAHR